MRDKVNDMRSLLATTGLCLALAAPSTADAFCGFYVSGAGGEMFNNATQVVLMREGTRTVLSMQNNYQGPPENFAMVVPVPEVLQEANVKTLDAKVFERVDRLAAPRLVEYWEQDPCQIIKKKEVRMMPTGAVPDMKPTDQEGSDKDLGVTVEAEFTVGEYQIVILSAKDSTGLDTWLKREKYQIPAGAEPLLRPYVEAGSKFFVAKVDSTKVTFNDGMAKLSPLRFHYDSPEFSLPVRLGMINSSGTQDLIVHILAKGKRYEVANYKNVTIPTNLDVNNDVRTRFGEFYAALFDATLEKNPGAVVTEYSWDASSCDPCPTPALGGQELATLGEDVLYLPGASAKGAPPAPVDRWTGFVLTRLHARYGKAALANDLIFKEAEAIAGGRETRGADGQPEKGSRKFRINNFQGRYAIRHEWTGPITCENPRRGIWGGPPPGVQGSSGPQPALELAFAPRGKTPLASFVRRDIPELGVKAESQDPPAAGTDSAQSKPAPPTQAPKKDKKEKKGCASSRPDSGAVIGVLLMLAWLLRRRTTSAPIAR